MKRNTKKALKMVIFGFGFSLVSGFLALMMWFSGTFLPVYVSGKYVLGNQIVRYELYIVLIVAFFAGMATVDYALDYLIKAFKRTKGR